MKKVRGRAESGQALDPDFAAAADYFQTLAQDPRFMIEFMLDPGEIMFANNYVLLHARTEFEDHPEYERRRHLLRMWLAMPNSRPLSPLMRAVYRDQRAGAVRGGLPARVPGTVVFETTEVI